MCSTVAWEIRSGHRYYYRKHRKGNKVISEYIGRGLQAEVIAKQDQNKRLKCKLLQKYLQADRLTAEAINRHCKGVYQLTGMIKAAALLGAGFHTHKRQWRKCHG
jgi:hypothetical protein